MDKYLLLIQGLYFFITGIWPLLSINTFQFVTGPKGALIIPVGLGLIVSGLMNSDTSD